MSTEILEPYDVVMQPAWNDQTARITVPYRDGAASDPLRRVRIPAGVTLVQVDNHTRFILTALFELNGTQLTLGTVAPLNAELFKVISENEAELWATLSSVPNTNDASTTRIGLKIIPGSGGGGFLGAFFFWWGGQNDRSHHLRAVFSDVFPTGRRKSPDHPQIPAANHRSQHVVPAGYGKLENLHDHSQLGNCDFTGEPAGDFRMGYPHHTEGDWKQHHSHLGYGVCLHRRSIRRGQALFRLASFVDGSDTKIPCDSRFLSGSGFRRVSADLTLAVTDV